MQPVPPCSASPCWWQMWELGVAVRHIIWGLHLFIFPPGYVALWDSKTPHRPAGESVSWCLESSLLRLPSQEGSLSLPLCLSFYLLFFVLPPFEDNGLLFWVPDVLCQNSEVVLWNLLSIQMFFRWICGGQSGLSVLFLCHLRTAYRRVYFGLKEFSEL